MSHTSVTSRDRLRTTLEHGQPNRIPLDFGSTSATGIHVSCVAALRHYYGLAAGPVEVLRRCEIFAPDGGFVFNSIHNLRAGTPVENIVAVLHAVHEFNGVAHA